MHIVFDIGGTNTRLAASKDGVTIGKPIVFPTATENFEQAMEDITKAARTLAGDTPITAVAGGIAGPLNTEKSMVIAAPNLPGCNNNPLKQQLAKPLRAPV
jgi:predicted NBD/HSP70 family sugar kinase